MTTVADFLKFNQQSKSTADTSRVTLHMSDSNSVTHHMLDTNSVTLHMLDISSVKTTHVGH